MESVHMEELEPTNQLSRPEGIDAGTVEEAADMPDAGQIQTKDAAQSELAGDETGTGSTVKKPRIDTEANEPEGGPNENELQIKAPAEADHLPKTIVEEPTSADEDATVSKHVPEIKGSSGSAGDGNGEMEDESLKGVGELPPDPFLPSAGAGDQLPPGPPDGPDLPPISDGPEGNRGEVVRLQREVMDEVGMRLNTAPHADREAHASDLEHAQTRLAEAFANVARSASSSPDSVTPAERITSSEMIERFPVTMVSPEAATIVFMTGQQQGDANFQTELERLLSMETNELRRTLRILPQYIPVPADHEQLDTAVRQLELWQVQEPEGADELHLVEHERLTSLVEKFSANAGARWQTYLDHYARMVELTEGNDEYYTTQLRLMHEQLMLHRQEHFFSDQFVLENTMQAVTSTHDIDRRLELAVNFLNVENGQSPRWDLAPHALAELAREIYDDMKLPEEDRQKVLDALNNNTDLAHVPEHEALHPHSRLLININSTLMERLVERMEAIEFDEVDKITKRLLHRYHSVKLELRAYAGAPMADIAQDIEVYNGAFATEVDEDGDNFGIDHDVMFSEFALKFASSGQPERALEAIGQIEAYQTEAFVSCWNAVPDRYDLDLLRPANMDLMLKDRFKTAQALHSNQPSLIAARGQELASRIIEKLDRVDPNLPIYEQSLVLDFVQFNQLLQTLIDDEQPEARELAEYLVRTAWHRDVPYTNQQMFVAYSALVASPHSEDLQADDIRLVRQAMKNDTDSPTSVTYFLANLAYFITR